MHMSVCQLLNKQPLLAKGFKPASVRLGPIHNCRRLITKLRSSKPREKGAHPATAIHRLYSTSARVSRQCGEFRSEARVSHDVEPVGDSDSRTIRPNDTLLRKINQRKEPTKARQQRLRSSSQRSRWIITRGDIQDVTSISFLSCWFELAGESETEGALAVSRLLFPAVSHVQTDQRP
ncbi:hypothetical protein AG1IA_04199 [Rhizoctonia solani AG-1 IA]|uniref:Uncharacterized protein n=1 Tax=Thanatephorus cucumeris (strain AG1-IA) TaxID=983506 RepID=L8WUJ0_THACA|nr:hypothetical protein AG1IA_04199 [Rhizoctonia solani AG-1 IA]